MHVHQIIEISACTTEDTEDHLNKKWWFYQTLVDKPFNVVQVTKVITFEFKFRIVFLSQFFKRVFDSGKGIREDKILGLFEERLFLVVLEFLILIQHRKNTEIH